TSSRGRKAQSQAGTEPGPDRRPPRAAAPSIRFRSSTSGARTNSWPGLPVSGRGGRTEESVNTPRVSSWDRNRLDATEMPDDRRGRSIGPDQRAAAARARAGGAAVAVQSGDDPPLGQPSRVEVGNLLRQAGGQGELEHLVEVAVVEPAVPAHGEGR